MIVAEDTDLFFMAHITAGTSDQEEIKKITRLDTRILTPCEDLCMQVLGSSRHNGRATMYVSASLEEKIFQVRTMQELKSLVIKRHESNQPVIPLTDEIINKALKDYDYSIDHHYFHSGSSPAKTISYFARRALKRAARTL
jgi:hypothetical protein